MRVWHDILSVNMDLRLLRPHLVFLPNSRSAATHEIFLLRLPSSESVSKGVELERSRSTGVGVRAAVRSSWLCPREAIPVGKGNTCDSQQPEELRRRGRW